MKKNGLIADAGADLPKEIIEKYHIGVVPIKMFWPEIENLPGVNTFRKMREAEKRGIKTFGKTSQPSVKDFLDIFEKKLSNFENIIGIILSSKLSGTFNVAVQAKNILAPKDQKRIFLVDSLNISSGQALLVLKAIDLIEKGKKTEEIVFEIEKNISSVKMIGIIPDPKWLEASGRISPLVANWIKKAAKIGICPVIKIKDGVLSPATVVLDAKDISLSLFKKFEKEYKKLDISEKKIRVVITHGDDWSDAKRLKERIENYSKDIEVVFLNIINDVVGVVAGPDIMTMAWLKK